MYYTQKRKIENEWNIVIKENYINIYKKKQKKQIILLSM